jgi:flagellar biosynthetic protein FlhB
MADSDVNKSEQPSIHKLEKARKKGAFARSQDFGVLVLLALLAAMTFALGDRLLSDLSHLMRQGLGAVTRSTTESASLEVMMGREAAAALSAAVPFMFLLWIAMAVAGAVQAKGVFTFEPLNPDFSRLNPAQGIKRVISLRSVFDLGRSVFKLCFTLVLAWFWWFQHRAGIFQAVMFTPAYFAKRILATTGSLLLALVLIYGFATALDWALARWTFLRQMRMSKREVKDEHKEREGDPRIKQRLRELRAEMLRKARALAKVPKSDFVVTNPVHFAVCLSYDETADQAPRVVAKGQGMHARLIRTIAHRSGVPVLCNPPLARELFASATEGSYIQVAQYAAVARILFWLSSVQRSGVQTA